MSSWPRWQSAAGCCFATSSGCGAPAGAANAGRFINGYFQALVLVSFVLGALTGVAMWFTSIQVSPRTIGVLVDEFHWIWATEWTFFCVEVVSGYAFLRYKDRLSAPRPDAASGRFTRWRPGSACSGSTESCRFS